MSALTLVGGDATLEFQVGAGGQDCRRGTKLEPELLIVMALALGAGAIVKGATGMGLPFVALPILAAFLGVPHAIAVMMLPIIVTNAWQLWQYRSHLDELDFLTGFLLAAIAGVVVGTWMLTALPEAILSSALGMLVLIYIAIQLLRPDFRIPLSVGYMLSKPVGFAAGALQGATGISAPIGVTFIHAMRLPRPKFVSAVSSMFLVTTIVQVAALWLAGVMTWPRMLQGLLALAPALALMPVGSFLGRMLSPAWFDRSAIILLGIVACQLIYRGVTG